MSAEVEQSFASSSRRFSKRIPATSVGPTFKLTLPADVVSAALGHLVDREFELLKDSGEGCWKVSILPRRNKDKYEYTLQGWKAFAESEQIKTGDVLDFILDEDDRLRASITRRQSFELQQLPATPQAHTARDRNSTSTEGNERIRQLSSSQGNSGSERSTLSLDAEQILDIFDPRNSPQGPAISSEQAVQQASFRLAPPEVSTPQQQTGSFTTVLSACQPSTEKIDVGLKQLFDVQQGWELPKRSRDEVVGDSKRRRRSCEPNIGRRIENRDSSSSQGLMQRSKSTTASEAMHPFLDVHLPALSCLSSSSARGRPPLLHSLRRNTMHPESSPQSEGGLAESPASKQHSVEGLQHLLQTSQIRAHRAEGEATALTRILGVAEGVLESETARGLAKVSALTALAERLASPQLLQFVEPAALWQLDRLRRELECNLDGVWDVLCHMRSLTHQSVSPRAIQQEARQLL